MLSTPVIATTTPSDALPARCDFPLGGYTHRLLHGPQTRGPGRASPVPATTFRTFHAPYGGGFLGAAPPGSSRLPWPSPCYSGLGSPLLPSRGWANTAAGFASCCGPLGCSHHVAFDAGLRRRAFPPDAASLLPGSLATTRTGLTPAGGDELTNTRELDHQAHRPPILSRVPSGHAVVAPAAQHRVEILDDGADVPHSCTVATGAGFDLLA